MAGVNKVILVGNLGKDPEAKTVNGSPFVRFSVATSESWKDKDGQKQERTEWHRCVAWNKPAEIIAQYVRKGTKLYVEGSLRTSSYEKNGEKRYSTEVIVSEFQMLDSKNSGDAPRQDTRINVEELAEIIEDEIPF